MPNYRLITPIDLRPQPDKYERAVARLCAEKFQSDILFVKRGISTTPDIQVVATGQFWEIKNIQGKGRHMIENNLRKASKQSTNVIVSLLKNPKITAQQAESRIRYVLRTSNIQLKHVKLVSRSGAMIDIK